jgi:hypothetical protein
VTENELADLERAAKNTGLNHNTSDDDVLRLIAEVRRLRAVRDRLLVECVREMDRVHLRNLATELGESDALKAAEGKAYPDEDED